MERGYNVYPWCNVFENLLDKQLDHFWRKPQPEKFSKDRSDWEVMLPEIKRRIKFVIHILNRMEPEIVDNVEDIQSLLVSAIPKEVRNEMDPIFAMMAAQTMMENEHRRSYALIDSILDIDHEKDVPFLTEKVGIISKWRGTGNDDTKKALSYAIVGTILSEGLVFNTLFSFFLFLQKKGLIPQTCIINEEVRVDENLHTIFYITLYRMLRGKGLIPALSQDEMHEIVSSFIHVEDSAIEGVLGNMTQEEKDFFLLMNVDNSKLYTRIVANSILVALDYDPLTQHTKDDNPYPFVDQSLINTLASFFDRDSTDYGLDVDHEYEEESDLED